jgi:hypothetical protein
MISSCQAKNDNYYQKNPKALEKAVLLCEKNDSLSKNCQHLIQLAKRMNELAYALQIDPQVFGQQILALQLSITNRELSQKEQVNKQTDASDKSIAKDKRKLELLLAIVRWKESPGG